ncbi:hypothetical protein [Sulfuricurvum sp.]|uniref:hypothetical protein n=1 Tax=Sulfuricurvum sp. TaxID=2025608 RepID=UPI002D69EED8|nr:hypothetical protein [Sulfuricurvum sp.]HZF70039.1 hypothetical protein [Sulfuricurvum sp.]
MSESKKVETMNDLMLETLSSDQIVRFSKYVDEARKILGKHFFIRPKDYHQWEVYLDSLDRLNKENTLLALKVILSITYHNGVLYHRQEILNILLEKQNNYCSNQNIPRKERIEFGIQVFQSWPNKVGSQFRGYFTKSVEKLFIEEVKEDPEYILEQFCRLDQNSDRAYIFTFGDHRPLEMLEISRNLKDYKPLWFANSLRSFLVDYNRFWANHIDEEIDPDKIKNVSFELYTMIVHNDFPLGFDVETTLQRLIQFSSMDEAWYGDLCVRLMDIECNKTQIDKKSCLNYFLIGINYDKETKYADEARKRFAIWGESYKTFDVSEHKLFMDFIEKIDTLFKEALQDTIAYARNMALSDTIERPIIDDLVLLCEQMIDWAYDNDRTLYFKLLTRFSRTSYSSQTIVKRQALAERIGQKFIEQFSILIKSDITMATEIVGQLLSVSSGSMSSKNVINTILNHVYFMLEEVASQNAKMELDKVLAIEKEFYEHYDRGGPSYWRPSYTVLNTVLNPRAPIDVARDVNTPPDTLRLLSQYEMVEVRRQVASNPNTPIEILRILSEDSELSVARLVAMNLNADEALLNRMFKNKDNHSSLAQNQSISIEMIRLLSQSENEHVRTYIAEHKKTPIDILIKLADDSDLNVRKNIAMNPNSSSIILDKLSRDQGRFLGNLVRKRVEEILSAGNKILDWSRIGLRFPVNVLEQGGIDKVEGEKIRSKVAEHPNTSIVTLKRMLNDEDWYVAMLAKKNLDERKIKA